MYENLSDPMPVNKEIKLYTGTGNPALAEKIADILHLELQGLNIEKFANGAAGAPFLVQRYITPFKTQILTPDDGIADMADDQVQREPVLYNNLEGLYCYNGTFQGIFSRLGPFPTISKPMKGITCATIWVD